jgi:nucleolar GTP-binding protein
MEKLGIEKLSMEKLPSILGSQELIEKAFRDAARIELKSRGPPRDAAKARERRRILVVSTTVTRHLSKIVSGFPSLANLHPFHRDLADAIVGIDKLRKSLGAVAGTSKTVNKITREHLQKLRFTKSPTEAAKVRRQAQGRISSIVRRSGNHLAFLQEAASKLSHLPLVYVDMRTIVIAGYPNVGKTTLLKALTGSAPKIAPYPFTTTGLQLGYFEHHHQRYQVVDTPGLLDRPLEKRNPIERQAIAALKHLADTIVFMLDPSETCGYELKDQLRLLDDIEKIFGGIEVVVVLNKADLLKEETPIEIQEKHPGAFFVTATTGPGVEELRKKLL